MKTIFDYGAVDVLAEALEILEGTERLLVVNNPDGGPANKTDREFRDSVRQYAFALCGEVHELADELGWKDWKVPKVPDVPRVLDEHADVLAFLGVMVQLVRERAAGVSHLDLAAQFREKSQVNIDRINLGKVEGYIGQTKRASQLELGTFYDLVYEGTMYPSALYCGEDPEGNYQFKVSTGDDYITVSVYPLSPGWEVSRTWALSSR